MENKKRIPFKYLNLPEKVNRKELRDSVSASKYNRNLLYEKQHGRCYYCQCLTFLVSETDSDEERHILSKVPNLATIEHLDDNFSSERHVPIKKHKIVLACYSCNQKKCKERVKDFVEGKFKRSKIVNLYKEFKKLRKKCESERKS